MANLRILATEEMVGHGHGTKADTLNRAWNIEHNEDGTHNLVQGTWTMVLSFGGASVGLTYGANTGYYAKIGNLVNINGSLVLTAKGTSVGDAIITGMPFTPAGNVAVAFRPRTITYANMFIGYLGTTPSIMLEEITEGGVRTTLTDANFANTSSLMIGVTYTI